MPYSSKSAWFMPLRPSRVRFALVLMLLLVELGARGDATAAPLASGQTGTIVGHVVLDGRGLGVLCSLPTGRSVVSALDGTFVIGGLAFGVYRVKCAVPLGAEGQGPNPRVVTLSQRAPLGSVRLAFIHTSATASDLSTLATDGQTGPPVTGVQLPRATDISLYAWDFRSFQGVGPTPTATDTPSLTPTPTVTDTPSLTPTPTVTQTPSLTPTSAPTTTPTSTPTETTASTSTATNTPTGTPTPSTCAIAIGFFAPDGTSFSLRTGDLKRGVVISYLSVYGTSGLVRAIPLVPRARVQDTLTCAVDAGTTTVNLDVRVATSTNQAIALGAILHVLIVRDSGAERVTITDRSTGIVLYSLTSMVAPQTFRIAIR